MIIGFPAIIYFFGVLGLAAAICLLLAIYSRKKPFMIYSLIAIVLILIFSAIVGTKEELKPFIKPPHSSN